MKIWIIRHGDPDYAHDSLTEKGQKQAELLSHVLARYSFDEIYLSPMGRAQKTAEPFLKLTGRKADAVLPWLQEAPWVWDRHPQSWTNNPLCYDPNRWIEAPEMDALGEKEKYASIEKNFYAFLEERGYVKDGNCFKTKGDKNEKSVIFFCHLGVGSFLLSRLLNVSPALMWQNFFLAPSSITLAQTEEMEPGHALFRVRELGALPHLEGHPELHSEAGAFRESAQSIGRWERQEKVPNMDYWAEAKKLGK